MALHRRNVLFGILSLPASTLLSGRPVPGLTATVYNGYELHTAIQAAGPGSSIVLAPGNYGDIGSFILAGSNVSVRVQTQHRAVFRSPVVVNGDFVDLDGLAFEEGIHLVGTGLKLQGSRLTGQGITTSGVNAEIANCQISNYKGQGIQVSANATNCYVHDNHVYNALAGASCAIRVGEATKDTNKRTGARIINNRCSNTTAGSQETLSLKSSGNTMSGNILSGCNNITIRHGESNLVSRNRLEGSKGIVCHDARNIVADNVLTNVREGVGIAIMAGSCPWNNQTQGKHPQAAYTVVRGNTGPLAIGRKYSGFNYPALETKVESHNGTIKLMFHSGTSMPGGRTARTASADGEQEWGRRTGPASASA